MVDAGATIPGRVLPERLELHDFLHRQPAPHRPSNHEHRRGLGQVVFAASGRTQRHAEGASKRPLISLVLVGPGADRPGWTFLMDPNGTRKIPGSAALGGP